MRSRVRRNNNDDDRHFVRRFREDAGNEPDRRGKESPFLNEADHLRCLRDDARHLARGDAFVNMLSLPAPSALFQHVRDVDFLRLHVPCDMFQRVREVERHCLHIQSAFASTRPQSRKALT